MDSTLSIVDSHHRLELSAERVIYVPASAVTLLGVDVKNGTWRHQVPFGSPITRRTHRTVNSSFGLGSRVYGVIQREAHRRAEGSIWQDCLFLLAYPERPRVTDKNVHQL